MTAREKLAKEHPIFVDQVYDGGCGGCPHDYGYLPKPDYCTSINNDTCRKCWDREIPEIERSASAMSESKKPRSILTFEDGHDEDLLYFERIKSGESIFATESGIYRFCPDRDIISETCIKRIPSHFERVRYDSFEYTNNIKRVVIDERISYTYIFDKTGRRICGSVLAPINATDKDVCKLIVEDLEIKYQKE